MEKIFVLKRNKQFTDYDAWEWWIDKKIIGFFSSREKAEETISRLLKGRKNEEAYEIGTQGKKKILPIYFVEEVKVW